MTSLTLKKGAKGVFIIFVEFSILSTRFSIRIGYTKQMRFNYNQLTARLKPSYLHRKKNHECSKFVAAMLPYSISKHNSRNWTLKRLNKISTLRLFVTLLCWDSSSSRPPVRCLEICIIFKFWVGQNSSTKNGKESPTKHTDDNENQTVYKSLSDQRCFLIHVLAMIWHFCHQTFIFVQFYT